MKKTSISKTVYQWIENNPYVIYSLRNDIINFSSLARKIQKELKILNFDAVIAACRRYQKEKFIIRSDGKEILSLIRNSRLDIKTGMFVYTMKPGQSAFDCIHMIKGSSSRVVITDKKIDADCIKSEENMVEVKIISPEKVEKVAGFIAHITGKLSEKGISIYEMYSCYTDTIFIISKKDLTKVIEVFDSMEIK